MRLYRVYFREHLAEKIVMIIAAENAPSAAIIGRNKIRDNPVYAGRGPFNLLSVVRIKPANQ